MDAVDFALSTCKTIYQTAENVKTNKERCKQVAQRVRRLEELVLSIKQRGPGQRSATVENALRDLCTTLVSAKALMTKFSQTKGVKSFLKANSHEGKFCQMNEKLTFNFQVLSGALQIEHTDMLNKVFERVSLKRHDVEDGRGPESFTNPPAPTPPLYTMPPTPVSPPPAPVSPPPAPTPPLYTMPPTPVSPPPAPTPPLNTLPPMPVSPPPAPMPPSLQMSNPIAPVPLPYIVPPRPVSAFTAPTPSHTASMSLLGNLSVSKPIYATLSPNVFSSRGTPQPVLRTVAPLRAPVARVILSTPNTPVAGSYVVSNSYFP